MRHPELNRVVSLLRTAVGDTSTLPDTIGQFQSVVWNTDGWEEGLSAFAAEILSDLAVDLDYFEASPSARAEDPAFFGEDRAVKEISAALTQLDSAEAG
jgi:hypothetical protein